MNCDRPAAAASDAARLATCWRRWCVRRGRNLSTRGRRSSKRLALSYIAAGSCSARQPQPLRTAENLEQNRRRRHVTFGTSAIYTQSLIRRDLMYREGRVGRISQRFFLLVADFSVEILPVHSNTSALSMCFLLHYKSRMRNDREDGRRRAAGMIDCSSSAA